MNSHWMFSVLICLLAFNMFYLHKEIWKSRYYFLGVLFYKNIFENIFGNVTEREGVQAKEHLLSAGSLTRRTLWLKPGWPQTGSQELLCLPCGLRAEGFGLTLASSILVIVNWAAINMGGTDNACICWFLFIWMNSQEWDAWVIWLIYVRYLRTLHTVFQNGYTRSFWSYVEVVKFNHFFF